MSFDKITPCVIETLTTVHFLQVSRLYIGEKACHIREHREIHRVSLLSEEATDACGIRQRYGVIRNEQFSERDLDQDSIEM